MYSIYDLYLHYSIYSFDVIKIISVYVDISMPYFYTIQALIHNYLSIIDICKFFAKLSRKSKKSIQAKNYVFCIQKR